MDWNGGLPGALAVLAWLAVCVGAMMLAGAVQDRHRRHHAEGDRYRALQNMASTTVGFAVCPHCDGPLTYRELRGGSFRSTEWLDADRCQALCPAHHDWKTDHKREALERLATQPKETP